MDRLCPVWTTKRCPPPQWKSKQDGTKRCLATRKSEHIMVVTDALELLKQPIQVNSERKTRLRTFALCTLVFQNTAIVLLANVSHRHNASVYRMSTVVASAEVLKMILCSAVVILPAGSKNKFHFLRNFEEYRILAIPAALYVVQNNAQFFAMKCLSPVVFVVSSQGKILTTAIFSVLLLRTAVSRKKMYALLVLIFGLALTQLPSGSEHGSDVPSCYFAGLIASAVASITSGFSSVFLERCFKRSHETVWERNIQLGVFSIPLAFVTSLYDPNKDTCHFFGGFDNIVLCLVLLQTLGGVVVSLVIKHANSILKNFSVAASICICTLYTTYVNHFTPPPVSLIGVVAVLSSIFLYSSTPED